MSSRFVLTAQLQLQAPSNVKSVVNQIKKQLRDINIDVQVETSARAVRQINQVTKATQEAATAAEKMGSAFGVSLKRFAAFSIASRAIGLFSTKLSGAIDDAISFQNEMVRLAQVTGKSLDQLKGVSDQIGVLSSTLGVASKDILGVTTILAQAGIEAQDLTVAINTLAKTSLSPTFGKIEDTAEGAVALLAQFGEGVGALERQLGAINKVSAKFAVESEDLVSVIRRTGGVFKASGGNLEELLALFTSVRATTRESAESIATGLRTIFTRIQRPATIQFLKQFGVELLDLEGKFVGPYKAFEQLSSALSGLEEGDVTFIRIAEELGGFRQIGKVIPLLRQFETAEKARQAAIEGGDSLNQDVITAQQSIQVQFTKTREAFLKLIREIADTSSFKILVQTSLDFANALIKVADGIKPLLPLIGAFAAVKFAQGAGSFIAGIGSGFRRPVGPTGKNAGGKIHAFARGGLVPGTGNRDTVPAMLSPGEFVIRKSSVNQIGADNLANINKYATGGIVKFNQADKNRRSSLLLKSRRSKEENEELKDLESRFQASKTNKQQPKNDSSYPGGRYKTNGGIAGFFLNPEKGSDELNSKLNEDIEFLNKNNQKSVLIAGSTIKSFFPYRQDLKKNVELTDIIDKAAGQGLKTATSIASVNVNKALDILPQLDYDDKNIIRAGEKLSKDKQVFSTVGGYIFEGIIQGITGAKLSGGRNTFDFPNVALRRSALAKLFTSSESDLNSVEKGDAKRTKNSKTVRDVFEKTVSDLKKGKTKGVQRLAKGGLAKGHFRAPLIDDLKNTPDAIQPNPTVALKAILASGYGALDVDRTLFRTIGDAAYAKAKTDEAKAEVLKRYFRDPKARLNDIKTAKMTQFGAELKKYIKEGKIDPANLSIISKSGRTPGLAEYINQVFGIPVDNMVFTSGGDKGRPLDAKRVKGPRSNRVRRAAGGGVSGQDTVPALLTPGEFVINKASAQRIGYGRLNNMNKKGIKGFAMGGPVGVQKFATGGRSDSQSGGGFNLLTDKASQLGFIFAGLGATLGDTETAFGRVISSIATLGATVASLVAGFNALTGSSLGIGELIKGALNRGPKTLGGGIAGASGGLIFNRQQRNQNETFRGNFQGVLDNKAARSQAAQSLRDDPRFQKLSDERARGLAELKKYAPTSDDPDLDLNIEKREKIRSKLAKIDEERKELAKSFSVARFDNKATSLTGRVGQFLGNAASRGGTVGRLAGVAGRGLSAAGGLGGGALVAGFSKLLGPLGIAITSFQLVNGAIGAFADYQNRANKAIEEGNVAKAKELSVLAEAPAIITLFGQDASKAFIDTVGNLFGGDTVAIIEANAEAQALNAKTNKEYAENVKKADLALRDFEVGIISADEYIKTLSANFNNVAAEFEAIQTLNAGKAANKSGGFTGGVRNLLSAISFGAIDSSGTRNARLDKEIKESGTAAENKLSQEIETLKKGTQIYSNAIFAAGGDVDKVIAVLKEKSPELFKAFAQYGEFGKKQEAQFKKELANQAKNAELRRKAAEALNLGLLNVAGKAEAVSGQLANILDGQSGASRIDQAIRTVELAITKSASAINPEDLEVAKGQLAQSLTEYGATSQELAKSLSSVDSVFSVQKQIGPALEKVREQLIKGAANDPTAQTEVLKREVLSGANVSDEQRQLLGNILDTFKLSDDDVAKITGGNFEEIADNISKLLSSGISDQFLSSLKVISDNQKKLGELTRQRVELERKAVESYKASIDIQLEARQALEEFGGPAVKSADKLTAFNKKIDATLNLAGVGGVGAGSTGAIGAISQQISEGLSQIASKRSTAAGIITEDASQEGLLLQAQTELVDYTRERLALIKEEISIQEKKNALEKSAFEKLLGGDIQGAIEDQAAAGAAKLLQAGETGLARLFGPQALLGGLKNLEETGASSNEKALAARTAASSLGVGSRLANAFAGATSEISALQGEGKKLASTLNSLGQSIANTDRMNVEAKSVIINTAQNLLRNQNAQVANNPLGASEVTRSAAAQANVNKAAAGEAITGLSPEVVKGFDTAINNFTAAVDKLQNMQLSVKLDTTNVNINFNGGSFLQNLSENIRGEVLKIVATEIPKYQPGTDGVLRKA